jgi:Subtilase family
MKANMNNMHMHMDPYMHSAFWYPDQITVTFQYPPDKIPTVEPLKADVKVPGEHASAGEGMADQRGKPDTNFLPIPTFKKEDALAFLNVESLNTFLTDPEQTHPYPALEPVDFTDTLRFPGDTPPDNPDHVGKYLFTSRDEDGNYVPTVIGFFKFDPGKVPASNAGSSSEMASSHGNGSMDNGQDRNNDGHDRGDIPPVVRLVKHINSNLDILKSDVPIVSASLTWVTGGSPFAPVGCPLIPPIPVPGGLRCSSSPGLFPITLPELPTALERMTGDGAHVLILDTLPRQEDITRAMEGAENHNLLLLDVANNVVMHHNQLPAVIDEPNPLQPKTGKDIKGRNGGGFRMADHGLFIAGIVRDIAPDAHVECIRALNDFCAGDSKAFVKALERIHNRMLLVNPDDHNKQGDLYQKQVVINLSLVVPPDDILKEQGVADPDKLRKELFKPIKSLVNQGALFVASAGNEGDARYQPANPGDLRPDALYPAAFAYHGPGNTMGLGNSMIPVGAVDKHGRPSSYSCYPGDLGIATYAGEVPKQFKQDKTGCFTEAEDIDALIGIYSSLSYPALLLEDCRPTYPIPNAHAWAYWLGTSFATPIMSGLVARMLQYRLENPGALVPPDISLPQTLMNVAATRQITWDRLDTSFTSKPGQMILAVQQCASKDSDDNDDDDDDEKRERVNIHVTINE